MLNLNRMYFNEHDRLPKYSLRVRIPLPALNSGSYWPYNDVLKLRVDLSMASSEIWLPSVTYPTTILLINDGLKNCLAKVTPTSIALPMLSIKNMG